jgi:hypothetical protein
MKIPVGKNWPEDTSGAAGSCNPQYRLENSRECARPGSRAAANKPMPDTRAMRSEFFFLRL